MSVAACLVLALGFVPVRSSVIAPAEVVAREPAFVRAPFAGIVDSIEVAPNAAVRAGRVLVRLERRQLAAEYSVAGKALEVATAQLRQTSQEAIADAKVRELLAGVRGRFDEARADFEYRKARLARADIAAPVDGVAVFNDPAEWIGRPVEIGERIMQVAPASSSRIEIELPASEMADFANDAEVSFFSNLKPNEPNAGHLIFMSYAATAMPSGVLAYIARADLEPGSKLRLGLKGSAKIFGRRQPLILWLLRRPLAYVHQLLA
jgi:multidrug resistance efflux pump